MSYAFIQNFSALNCFKNADFLNFLRQNRQPVSYTHLDVYKRQILTNGPVSRFDYYLDVYDKNGQVRTEPERTTFDLSDRRGNASEETPAAYYVPDTPVSYTHLPTIRKRFLIIQRLC